MRRARPLLPRLAISAAVFVVASEVVLRTFAKPLLPVVLDERSLSYRYDEELGWFPVPGAVSTFVGNRPIHVANNSLGFRDDEWGAKKKPRIAVFGDSFVWGYDAEKSERFTEQLHVRIPAWDVLNLGVSGYGTDQEYLVLRKTFDRLRPDIVFVVYSSTDPIDNVHNNAYRVYYKPYFTVEREGLRLHGVPVPKSMNYFYGRAPWFSRHWYLFRALVRLWFLGSRSPAVEVRDPTASLIVAARTFCSERGSRFAMAFADRNPELERFCAERGIPAVILDSPQRYPVGAHFTPEGNRFAAAQLWSFLRESGWLGEGR